ncbi:MAG: IPT/TIG domain-containing protein, partial [Patescibacteria group bacterium]
MSFKRLSLFAAFFLALVGAGLLVAHPALAQVDLPAFKTFAQGAGFATTYTIPEMIVRLIRTFLGFLGIILVILILYAGFVYMTSGGNVTRVQKAKDILSQAIIGVIIVLSSFIITQFILSKLGDVMGPGPVACAGLSGGALTCCENPSAVGCSCVGATCNDNLYNKFHLSSTNTAQCSIGLRNLEPQFIFSQPLDSTTVSDGITIRQKGGDPVAGTFVTSGTMVTFTPTATCPDPNPTAHCFLADTEYEWVLDSTILKAANGDGLKCLVGNANFLCAQSFITGSGVDVTPPTISMKSPNDGASVAIGMIQVLQAETKDDTGVSTVDFFESNSTTPIFSSGLNFATNSNGVAQVLSADPLKNFFSTDPQVEWDTTGHQTNQSYTLWARASDCAGHTVESATISAMVRPASCDNGVIDAPGETGIDCGGDSTNAATYCGACVPSPCTTHANCASGWCEAGQCVDRPRIDLVSPDNGAIESLITISGDGFGTTGGTISFQKNATEKISVNAYQCGTTVQWSNKQIVVQVPPLAVDGPIEVKTSANKTDATNDLFGPINANFDVNAIKRPGLCSVAPVAGQPGTEATFSGLGFGTPQGTSTVYFKNFQAPSYPSWLPNAVKTVVPNMSSGSVTTQMFVGDYQCINGAGVKTNQTCTSDADCGTGNTCAMSLCSETLAYCDANAAAPCGATGGTCGSVRMGSNSLSFSVVDPAPVATLPNIKYVESGWKACKGGANNGLHCATVAECPAGTCDAAPNWGPKGQYITIFGTNFGSAIGAVRFKTGLGKNALGDTIFPPQCGDAFWHDTSITVKVPDEYDTNTAVEPGAHQISVVRADGQISNLIDFNVTSGVPGPSICLLDPSSGPVTTTSVEILGENLGTIPGTVTFFDKQTAPFPFWTPTNLDGGFVPLLTASGPVSVTNSVGYSSNPLNFTVGSCKDTPSLCAANQQCCGDGSCSLVCKPPPPQSHLAYRISTGTIPTAPTVKISCTPPNVVGASGIVSPGPWEKWSEGKATCLNAAVTATFENIAQMDTTSFEANVIVETCSQTKTDGSCESWNTTPVAGHVAATSVLSFTWEPDADFAPTTRYRVTIKGGQAGVRSLAMGTSPGVPMAADFSWQFVTGSAAEFCQVSAINISPTTFTANALDQDVGYSAQLLAKDYQCLTMTCKKQLLDWSSNIPNATIATTSPAEGICDNVVKAKIETNPGTPAKIKATLATAGVANHPFNTGDLHINFSDPTVVAFFPNCSTACVNAKPWVRLNTEIAAATLPSTAVKIYKCANSLCANDGTSVLQNIV